jgi:disulfide bond formation protein DsbB
MYPLVVILGLELTRKHVRTRTHALVLATIGACISGYQYLLQLGIIPPPPCTVGAASSCAQKFTMGFGYITIPLMAFTAFAMIITFLSIGHVLSKKNAGGSN